MDLLFQAMEIPLHVEVRHASHARTSGESIVVIARSEDRANLGLGEGCPRDYVTGETLTAALQWLHDHRTALTALESRAELDDWAAAHETEIVSHPAAWCAVESALLDGLARQAGQSIEAFLGVDPSITDFEYTAVLFDAPLPIFEALVARHVEAGFRRWKFRVSGDLEQDRARLRALLATHPTQLRIDANNRWAGQTERAFEHFRQLFAGFDACPIHAIEEPLAPGDVEGLAAIGEEFGVVVILDESARSLADLGPFTGRGNFAVNVKVSRAGGVRRALALARAARARGWPIVVGAQVGETSLLTRLALVVARDSLADHEAGHEARFLGQEGAYGTRLLTRDIVQPELRFGMGGRLSTNGLGPHGLGLDWLDPLP